MKKINQQQTLLTETTENKRKEKIGKTENVQRSHNRKRNYKSKIATH